MSKETVRQRVQQRHSRQRRQTQTILIVVVAILALGVVGILIAFNSPHSPKPALASDFAGIPEGLDQSGAIALTLGRTDARVTLTEYGDFSCPHCHDLEPTIHQLITDYVKPGKLRIIYKTVTFVGGAYSQVAAQAAICAARQGKGWEMHDQIWGYFDSNGPQAYSQSTMTSLAENIGLDTTKFGTCYNAPDTSASVQSVADEVLAIGVTSTPTLFINGNRLDYTGPDSVVQAVQSAAAALPATNAASATAAP